MDRGARGGLLHGIRTWCQPSNKLSVYKSTRCFRAWKLHMQLDMSKHEVDRPSTRWIDQARVMQPDIWEEWWRLACVLDMKPAMWSTRCRLACVPSHAKRHTGCHQPEADWLVSPINTPRPQLI
ncbi:hypothetical protein F2Q70_00029702 [Brassica cretica]|uniref:Uncharacterized protein n=1 Tax=Brassica cretica TaxID=69181 RepID=A0A8S9FEC4_BRACR|nr:hypothetical protein F2Q70_00029702 [Brassica cretica]KAF2558532.1 hypothetical protein F2Q68_00015336 [Brassica cretica]